MSVTPDPVTARAQVRLRVVIAEDTVLLREGLRRVLTDAGLDVAGTAGDADQLLQLVEALRPDVVLADIRMPPTQTTEGLQAALEIRRRWPGTAVIVLSQHVETEHLFELLATDPRGIGYVLKERVADIAQFTDAIRRVAAGESVIDPEVVSRLVARPRRDSPLETLTERELAVLALMAEGRSKVQGSEGHDLGSDRQVVVIVAGAADIQVDAAMRGRGEAAAVEGDPAGGEEHGVRHRLVVLGADVIRASLPLDVEGAAGGRSLRAGRPGFHGHRAVGDPAIGLQPGEVVAEVHAGGRRGRAGTAGPGTERRGPCDRGIRRRARVRRRWHLDSCRPSGQGWPHYPGRRVICRMATLPAGRRGARDEQEGQDGGQPITSCRHGRNLHRRTRNRRPARRRAGKNWDYRE